VETDTTGFLSGGPTLSRDTAQAWHGQSSLKVVTNTNAYQSVSASVGASAYKPNQPYTFSAYMKWDGVSNGGVAPTLRFYCQANDLAPGNTSIGSVGSVTLTTSWARYVFTVTMPTVFSNGGYAFTAIGLRADTGSPGQAATYWMDGLQIEAGGVASAWHQGYLAPSLVRQGKVQIYDASGNNIYTGFAAKLDDKTDKTKVYTEVECYDQWQDMDRVIVNKVYINQSDVAIIRDLFTSYAPQIDLSLVPTSGSFVFPDLKFREKSLQHAAQYVADTTGFQLYITPAGKLLYQPLTAAGNAPFSLTDTNPNGVTTAGLWVTEYTQDDNAIVNRVFVHGGNKLSSDFTQDISNQVTATNLIFTLAYVPHKASDGAIHVTANGVALVVGYANSSDALKSAGGTKDVLIDQDNHTATFSSVPATPLTVKYRYYAPLIVVVTNAASFTYFGRYFDTEVNDSSIVDSPTALARARALLATQGFGLTHIVLGTRMAGLQAGMLVRIDHSVRNIHDTYQVQKVTYQAHGNGVYFYEVELGAWKWSIVDVLMWADRHGLNDQTEDVSEDVINAQQLLANVAVTTSLTTSLRTGGGYYARTAPVGDGHDAYAGLFTITS
jgi:hypothetical protein